MGKRIWDGERGWQALDNAGLYGHLRVQVFILTIMGSLEVLKTKATQVTILWTEKIESVKLFLKILDYKCH